MDDYKRTAVDWGRKDRKRQSRTYGRALLKQAVKKEPTEPEVHPAEIRLIEYAAECATVGHCSCDLYPDGEPWAPCCWCCRYAGA